MKLEKETALYNRNAIANEISNFTNEIVEINGGLQQLEQQIDGQVVTWFYNYTPTLNNLPASGWDSDEKELHLGDIFYNTTTYLAYVWSKSGSTYSWNRISNKDLTTALQTANNALDTADKKRRVFISTSSQQTPTPPYDYGDIWFQGSYYDKDILTCVYADGRQEGASFVRNDWAKLNKYTDDSALTTFLNGTYSSDKTNLQSQIDKKAETWYQSGDPSTAWTTEALKAEHEGDLWYKTTNQTSYRYSKINNVYSWQQENVPTEVFDKIDGKSAVYTSQPSPPYNVGDLWFNSTSSDILTCMQSRISGQYISSDWVKRNKYTDDSYARTLASKIGDTPDYFWHDDTGAYVTQVPQSEWTDEDHPNYHSGGNVWITSNGINLRDGETKLYSSKIISDPVLFLSNEKKFSFSGNTNSENEVYIHSFELPSNCKYIYEYRLFNASFYIPSISDWPIVFGNIYFNEEVSDTHCRELLYNGGTNRRVYLNLYCYDAGDPGDEVEVPMAYVTISCESGLNNYRFDISWDRTYFRYKSKDPSSGTDIGYGGAGQYLLACRPFSNGNACFSVAHSGETKADSLYLKKHSDPIGRIYSASTADEISYGSSTTAEWKHLRSGCSITLSDGVYLVTSMVRINYSVSDKVYGLAIGYRLNGSNDHYLYSRTSFKASGGRIQLTTQYIASSSASSIEYHPAVYIEAGSSSTTVTNRMIRAVRIV